MRSVRYRPDGSFEYAENPRYEPPYAPFKDDRARLEDYAGRNWFDGFYPVGAKDNAGCHYAYHFEDVAIERNSFDRNDQGINDHDLVAAINAALAVLLDWSAT